MTEEILLYEIGIITEAGDKAKKDGTGTYFRVTVGNKSFGLFDGALITIAKENKGKRARLGYIRTDKGTTAKTLEPMPDLPAESNGEMTKEDWERKDLLNRRTEIVLKMIETGQTPFDPATLGKLDAWTTLIYGEMRPLATSQVVEPKDKPPEGIDISPIKDLPEFTARFKKYFGEGRTSKEMTAEILKFACLETATELGKRSVEDLNLLWQGICVAKSQAKAMY